MFASGSLISATVDPTIGQIDKPVRDGGSWGWLFHDAVNSITLCKLNKGELAIMPPRCPANRNFVRETLAHEGAVRTPLLLRAEDKLRTGSIMNL